MYRGQRDLLNGKLLTEGQRSRGQEGKLFKLATLGINSFCLRKQTDNSLTSCHPDLQSSKKAAFTLAEVLITLAVIGVVAAITMPVLMTNINERVNSERQVNIVYKINQAMEHMRSQGKLTAYDSTESFVNELQKHLKITKVCDNEHLAECWPVDTVIKGDGEEFNIADAKTGENFSLTTDTNNVGLILADGASLILNFDNNFQGMDIGEKILPSPIGLPNGGQSSKVYLQYTTNLMAPLAFIMDVNGKKGPNKESADGKYYDIRNFNGARLTESTPAWTCPGDTYNDTCVYYVGTSYTAINCNDPNGELYSYCSPTPSGYTIDRWAGANAKCASMNMTLPTVAQLQTIYQNKSNYPSISSFNGWFWSSEEYSGLPQSYARNVYFGNGYAGIADYGYKHSQGSVLCLDN